MPRRAAGRGHLHRLRHRGGAPRRCSGCCRPRAGSATRWSHSRRRALGGAARGRAGGRGTAPDDRSRCPSTGSGGTSVDAAPRPPRRRGVARGRRPGGQPRGRHPAAGRRGRGGRRTTSRSSSTPAPSPGRLPLPAGWSAAAGLARTSGAARPGVGVLLVRKGARWRNPFPGRRPRSTSASPASRTSRRRWPRRPRCRPWSPSGDEVDARQHALVDRIRAGSPPTVPDVEVVGDPVRPAAPPGDVLLPLRRRRGAGDRARPARLRRRQRLGLHRLDASSRSHVLAAMGVLTHGNVRVSLPRDTTEADVDAVPGRAARGRGRAARPRWACDPWTPTSSSTAAGCAARCRSSSWPGASPTSPVGGMIAVVADDAGRPGRRRRPGAGCAGRSTSARTPPTDGVPRYLVRRAHLSRACVRAGRSRRCGATSAAAVVAVRLAAAGRRNCAAREACTPGCRPVSTT